jgi:hypothetical protein
MGGAGESQRQWRLDMHKPAIVVGTVDSLVSKALNRGYGIGRASYPIDFALVTSGAHWVIDEIQLCPESMTTLRQLAAFVMTFRTAEPFGLTCMSATVPEGLLETVDNPKRGDVVGILPEERTGELAVLLWCGAHYPTARRRTRRLQGDRSGGPGASSSRDADARGAQHGRSSTRGVPVTAPETVASASRWQARKARWPSATPSRTVPARYSGSPWGRGEGSPARLSAR